jgi:hypothetical protein
VSKLSAKWSPDLDDYATGKIPADKSGARCAPTRRAPARRSARPSTWRWSTGATASTDSPHKPRGCGPTPGQHGRTPALSRRRTTA